MNVQLSHPKQRKAQGKSGLVIVKARWMIERLNAWMERQEFVEEL